MPLLVWVLQFVVAVMFLFVGGMKLALPPESLVGDMAWVADSPTWLVKFVGLAEVLGAVGVVVPSFTRVVPWLTPVAAAGLALIMGFAGAMHATRGEVDVVPANVVLLVLCLVIVWARTYAYPITPKESFED